MRRTLVLSLGTAACGAALHFRRRREGELRFFAVGSCAPLRRSSPRLNSDASNCSAPFGSWLSIWMGPTPIASRRRSKPRAAPGRSAKPIRSPSIRAMSSSASNPANYLKWTRSIPKRLVGLDAENASGGARPNADFAFQVAADRIRSALTDALIELLKNRQASDVRAEPRDPGLPDGRHIRRNRQRILRTCQAVALADRRANSGFILTSIPSCWYRVHTARKTRPIPMPTPSPCSKSWQRMGRVTTGGRAGVDGAPACRLPGAVPIGDINNAPDAPRIVSESAFAALAGDIIYELATTPRARISMRRSATSASPGTTPRSSASPAKPAASASRRYFSTWNGRNSGPDR